MVFLRRICSSRPGDGEQRRQSLAALTVRGRGLYCSQPQPRQPALRQNKLRIFRFRASAKAQSLRLFLLSPRSRLLRGDPIYGRTLCVQTGWATHGVFLARRKLASGSSRAPCAFPNLRCCPRCWLFSCLGVYFHLRILPESTERSAAAIFGRSAPSLLFHGALWNILLSADLSAVLSRIPSDFALVNIAFEYFSS